MKFEQRVQIRILGAPRPYSYAWWFDPAAGELPLQIGDKVELPPNQVQEDGSSGEVVAVGTSYKGELKSIVRVIKRWNEMPVKLSPNHELYNKGPDEVGLRRPGGDDDMWTGFGTGDYA